MVDEATVNLQQPASELLAMATHDSAAGPPIDAGDSDVHFCAIALHATGEITLNNMLTDEDFDQLTSIDFAGFLPESELSGDWTSTQGTIEVGQEHLYRGNTVTDNYVCEVATVYGINILHQLTNRVILQNSNTPRYIRISFKHSGRATLSRNAGFNYDMEAAILSFDAGQTLIDQKANDFYTWDGVAEMVSWNHFNHTYLVAENCHEIHVRFQHTGPYSWMSEGALLDFVKIEQMTIVDHRDVPLTASIDCFAWVDEVVVSLQQPASELLAMATHDSAVGPPIYVSDVDIHFCVIALHATGELTVNEVLTDEDFNQLTSLNYADLPEAELPGDWTSVQGTVEVGREYLYRGNAVTDNYVCEVATVYGINILHQLTNRVILQSSNTPRYIRISFDHSGRATPNRDVGFNYDMEAVIQSFDAGQTLIDQKANDFYTWDGMAEMVSWNHFNHTYLVAENCYGIHVRFEHTGPYSWMSVGALLDFVKIEQMTIVDHRDVPLIGLIGGVYSTDNINLSQPTGTMTALARCITLADADCHQPASVLVNVSTGITQVGVNLLQPASTMTALARCITLVDADCHQPASMLANVSTGITQVGINLSQPASTMTALTRCITLADADCHQPADMLVNVSIGIIQVGINLSQSASTMTAPARCITLVDADCHQPVSMLMNVSTGITQVGVNLSQPASMMTALARCITLIDADCHQPVGELTSVAMHDSAAGPPIVGVGDNDIHFCAIALHATGEITVDEVLTDEDFDQLISGTRHQKIPATELPGDWIFSHGNVEIGPERLYRSNNINDNYLCELATAGGILHQLTNRVTLQNSNTLRYIRVSFDHSGREVPERTTDPYYDMEAAILTFDASQTLIDQKAYDFYDQSGPAAVSWSRFNHTHPVAENCHEIHVRFEHTGPHSREGAGALLDSVKIEQMTFVDHRDVPLIALIGGVYSTDSINLLQPASATMASASCVISIDADCQQPMGAVTAPANCITLIDIDCQQPTGSLVGVPEGVTQVNISLSQDADCQQSVSVITAPVSCITPIDVDCQQSVSVITAPVSCITPIDVDCQQSMGAVTAPVSCITLIDVDCQQSMGSLVSVPEGVTQVNINLSQPIGSLLSVSEDVTQINVNLSQPAGSLVSVPEGVTQVNINLSRPVGAMTAPASCITLINIDCQQPAGSLVSVPLGATQVSTYLQQPIGAIVSEVSATIDVTIANVNLQQSINILDTQIVMTGLMSANLKLIHHYHVMTLISKTREEFQADEVPQLSNLGASINFNFRL